MNYYTDMNVKAEQRNDALREAETSRLLRQAGVGRPGWLRVQVDKVECRVGGVLVDLGGRMMCREAESQTALSAYTS